MTRRRPGWTCAGWGSASATTEDTLLHVVERAVEAHVLEATAEGARFAHALIREVLYAGVLPVRRRGWHRRAGEALSAAAHPDPDAVAYHFHQAGDARAAAWLVRAGERAERANAYRTAAARYEAALALAGAGEADRRERAWLRLRL